MVLVNKLSPMEAIKAGKNCVTRQQLNKELKKYYEGSTSLIDVSPAGTDISSLIGSSSSKSKFMGEDYLAVEAKTQMEPQV